MTEKKDTRPGAAALRRLADKPLQEAVTGYERQIEAMEEGSPARRIVKDLIGVGRAELKRRGL